MFLILIYMSLTQDQIIKVDALYTDPSKGLTTFKKVYDYLKTQKL